jgi:hypothetical protein
LGADLVNAMSVETRLWYHARALRNTAESLRPQHERTRPR